ncbi:unnamed protein product [Amoebophrya sp. A120]|nr:unnamed protein product [Amoebophrya sp. A120]|eukprot:GSA120T00012718001.1
MTTSSTPEAASEVHIQLGLRELPRGRAAYQQGIPCSLRSALSLMPCYSKSAGAGGRTGKQSNSSRSEKAAQTRCAPSGQGTPEHQAQTPVSKVTLSTYRCRVCCAETGLTARR